MGRVSYQSMLGEGEPARPARTRVRYVSLRADTIQTRRKDADKDLRVRISREQRGWLREVREVSGKGIDDAAIVRAMLDLARELPIDWPMLAGGEALRSAVRESVRLRSGGAGPTAAGT